MSASMVAWLRAAGKTPGIVKWVLQQSHNFIENKSYTHYEDPSHHWHGASYWGGWYTGDRLILRLEYWAQNSIAGGSNSGKSADAIYLCTWDENNFQG